MNMFRLTLQIIGYNTSCLTNVFQSFLRQSSGYSGSGYKFQQRRTTRRNDGNKLSAEEQEENENHQENTESKRYNQFNEGDQARNYSTYRRGANKYNSFQLNPKKKVYKQQTHDTENNPNLLTWDEKQQMRMLNEQSPDDWTPERLAGVFPASVSTVKKILNTKWKPHDIDRHDNAVAQHWKQFKDGKLNQIEPSLNLHLKKFLPVDSRQEHQFKSQQTSSDLHHEDQSAKLLLHSDFKEEGSISKINAESRVSDSKTGAKKTIVKYESKKVSVQKQKQSYSEKIVIPEDKWKDGATYKVGDAYYHSDGTFLYRVPGMT